jgi:hypothetical protein
MHDPVDRALFFSSTYIIIGNGEKYSILGG